MNRLRALQELQTNLRRLRPRQRPWLCDQLYMLACRGDLLDRDRIRLTDDLRRRIRGGHPRLPAYLEQGWLRASPERRLAVYGCDEPTTAALEKQVTELAFYWPVYTEKSFTESLWKVSVSIRLAFLERWILEERERKAPQFVGEKL